MYLLELKQSNNNNWYLNLFLRKSSCETRFFLFQCDTLKIGDNMKNLSDEKIILIRRLIGLGSAIICLLLMLLNFINFTSTSTVNSSSSITWDEGFSLFSFLFNGKTEVLAMPITYLREIFGYSYVVMWIVFSLVLISICVLAVGIFMKKSIVSKIGSCFLVSAIVLLFTMSFDRYSIGNTVMYLDMFTWGFWLIAIISAVGLYSTIMLKDK